MNRLYAVGFLDLLAFLGPFLALLMVSELAPIALADLSRPATYPAAKPSSQAPILTDLKRRLLVAEPG